eukprot:60811_1
MAAVRSISVTVLLKIMFLFAVKNGKGKGNAKAETVICSETSCDFNCPPGNPCDDDIFICTNKVKTCTLNCKQCNNVTVQSSAQETTILCSKPESCHIMDIEITPSYKLSDYNEIDRFELICSERSSCSKIDIFCDGIDIDNCQCRDYGHDLCVDDNISGNYSIWTQTTKQPTIQPTSAVTITTDNYMSTISDRSTTSNIITVINDNDIKELNDEHHGKDDESSHSTVLIVLLIITCWIFICVAIPLYWKHYKKEKLKQQLDDAAIEVAVKPKHDEYDLTSVQDPDGNKTTNQTEGILTIKKTTSIDEMYEGIHNHITMPSMQKKGARDGINYTVPMSSLSPLSINGEDPHSPQSLFSSNLSELPDEIIDSIRSMSAEHEDMYLGFGGLPKLTPGDDEENDDEKDDEYFD